MTTRKRRATGASKGFGPDWWRRFEAASADERRTMLAAAKAAQAQEFAVRMGILPPDDPAPTLADEDREAVDDFLRRTGQPVVDLDEL